jgi:hypothetical protein
VTNLRSRRIGALLLALLALPLAAAEIPELSLAPRTLRIAVVGDAGRETATIARGLAAAAPFDAILLVGDNFYPCGVKSPHDPKWHVMDPLSALGIPIYAVLGNHDHCGNAGAQIGAPLPNWQMPAAAYALRSAVADFAMLDTTPYAQGRTREAEATLGAVFARSTTPWRIAVGHHVITSSGWHSIFPRSEARNMRRLLPPLRTAHVDLYICGHDHHEELLGGSPLLLVSGAGSDPVPMVTVRDQTLWPHSTHFREPIAFAVVEITASTLSIRFFDANGRPKSPAFTTSKTTR